MNLVLKVNLDNQEAKEMLAFLVCLVLLACLGTLDKKGHGDRREVKEKQVLRVNLG